MVSSVQMEPVSRTDQYKRVMKPLLERKRRARINRCLDELRDLLVAALQAEGETVTRLEKADILELTVRHVRRLNQRRRLTIPPSGNLQDPRQDAVKFQQGFLAAAQQVQSFLLNTPALEPSASSRLLVHLSSCASAITGPTPSQQQSSQSTHDLPQSQGTLMAQVLKQSPSPTPPAPLCRSQIIIPKCSPPISPPPLIDLSMKQAHSASQHHGTSRLIAPTPIRKEPVIIIKDPYPSMPQDLSVRRNPSRSASPPQDTNDAWRPW